MPHLSLPLSHSLPHSVYPWRVLDDAGLLQLGDGLIHVLLGAGVLQGRDQGDGLAVRPGAQVPQLDELELGDRGLRLEHVSLLSRDFVGDVGDKAPQVVVSLGEELLALLVREAQDLTATCGVVLLSPGLAGMDVDTDLMVRDDVGDRAVELRTKHLLPVVVDVELRLLRLASSPALSHAAVV
ncbi:hypothetical protein FGO68_gene5483 [Halteria grandinella]|uniref:Uncharacterized protein n=1 Tax=Halteria grandinella TaxID=5974 RepID=A0A8J8SWL8_HALGN|nr:hypothetical protein FGO68_gene5483 [Halteria grandinella]